MQQKIDTAVMSKVRQWDRYRVPPHKSKVGHSSSVKITYILGIGVRDGGRVRGT